jgi:Ca2+:H+ antiporter
MTAASTSEGGTKPSLVRRIFALENLLNWLLVFVPVSAYLHHAHADDLWVFVTSCLAIIPLAGLMGHSTEGLAAKAGPGIGGLLNASFGNAAELIIAIVGLRAGKVEIVQASITGSIIGNLLFVFGLAAFCGGLKRDRQTFNRTAAGVGASMLFLGVIGLMVPTIVTHAFEAQGIKGADLDKRLVVMSEWIAAFLLATYVAKLLFSLRTHHHLYNEDAEAEAEEEAHWGLGFSIGVLVVATALTAVVAEQLVGAVEAAAHKLHLNDIFVGVVVVAIIGNAAEHSTAVIVAMKGKMNLANTIAVESSLQIALFVAPVLVFVGLYYPAAKHPMTLHFTDLEAFSVAISVGATALISLDGETTWLEGFQLLSVYGILGVAFFFAGVPS